MGEGGALDLEVDDSPVEVRALLAGRAFGLAWDAKERVEWANPGMISPLGRGHRGGTLIITINRALYNSWGRGSSGNRGAYSKHARVGAGCGKKGGDGGRAGAWSGGPSRRSGALAHPRREKMSSSCLRHCRA